MQWGQIKTLFILSFLILDLFLLQQFLSKQEQAEVGSVSLSTEEESTAEKLENAGIKISSNVPNEAPSVPVIQASPINFSEKDLKDFEKLEDEGEQNVEVYSNNLVTSIFNEPIEVDEERILSQVKKEIPLSNQYSYWGWDKDNGVVLFFQKAKNHTIYFNMGGLLVVKVEDGKMIGYSATRLGSFEEPPADNNNQSLMPPLKIIDKLNEDHYISSGDEITHADVGYHTSINLEPGEETGTQVFAPTWKITVNNEEDFFVRARQGIVLNIDDEAFIKGTVESFRNRIIQSQSQMMDNEQSLKELN